MPQPAGYTIKQYDALCNAIAEGVRQVQYSDKMVTYRSLDEMIRIKNEMQKDLNIGNNAQVDRRFAGRNVGCFVSGK